MNIPPIVTHHLENVLLGLRESHFFDDYEITEKYAHKLLTDELMDIYVSNPSMENNEFFWSEEEFEVLLQKIVTGSIMYELVDDGVLNSYEDEDTEETFFLTEKGKMLSDELKKQV
jgi:hypothetical protein